MMVNAVDAAEGEEIQAEMRAPRTTGHDSAGYEDVEAVEAGPVTGEEAAQQVSRPDPNAASSNELREGHADRAEPENEPAEGGPVTGEGAAQQVPRPDPNPANSNELREGHENQADARETGAAATRRQRSRSPRGRERGPQGVAIRVLQAVIELLRAEGQPLREQGWRASIPSGSLDPTFISGISIHTFFWVAAPPGWEPSHCSPWRGGVPHAKMVCLEILRGGTVVWRGTQTYRGTTAVGRFTVGETLPRPGAPVVQGEWIRQGEQMIHCLRVLAARADPLAEVWTRMSWVPGGRRLGRH